VRDWRIKVKSRKNSELEGGEEVLFARLLPHSQKIESLLASPPLSLADIELRPVVEEENHINDVKSTSELCS
jgi:hypothetical protein